MWTILNKCNFKHPQNKENKGRIHLFNNKRYPCYPDFYREGEWIIDAKYKQLKDNHIEHNDIYQVVAYMHVERATVGSILYPIKSTKASGDNTKLIIPEEIGTLRGHGGRLSTYGIPIPNEQNSFLEFQEK